MLGIMAFLSTAYTPVLAVSPVPGAVNSCDYAVQSCMDANDYLRQNIPSIKTGVANLNTNAMNETHIEASLYGEYERMHQIMNNELDQKFAENRMLNIGGIALGVILGFAMCMVIHYKS